MSSSSTSQRRSAANLAQPRPTSPNLAQPRPTSPNLGQPRPTSANLVLGVTKAISELAERETRQSSQPEAPPAQASPTQASDGSAQAGGGPVSPERAAEVPLSHAALQQTPRRTLAFSHSLNPRVQHYAIAHFRAIRAAFGISPKAFAAAFASLLPELQHPSRRSYRLLGESVSEGGLAPPRPSRLLAISPVASRPSPLAPPPRRA